MERERELGEYATEVYNVVIKKRAKEYCNIRKKERLENRDLHR
jgi:hypothetical protein